MPNDGKSRQFNAGDALAQRLVRRVFLDDVDVTERCAAISLVTEEPFPTAEAEGTVLLFEILREEEDRVILGFDAEEHRGRVRIEFDLEGRE